MVEYRTLNANVVSSNLTIPFFIYLLLTRSNKIQEHKVDELQEAYRDAQEEIRNQILKSGRQSGKSSHTIIGQALSMADEAKVRKSSITSVEKNKKKKAKQKAKMSRKRNNKS